MGGTPWDEDQYVARASLRAASGAPVFKHHVDVQTGKAATACHPSLNPFGVKIRESRDSDVHPESRAVAVFLDQTGSMQAVPEMVQKKLPALMGLLLRKTPVVHPHVLVGAIGDAHNGEQAPLQVGQFEAGIEIDNDISNLFMEAKGGGSGSETYELAMYFMAKHTSIDCFEKRGQKGFMFIVGDERFYPTIGREVVKKYIGDTLEADIPTPALIKELQQRYEVFYIMPKMTANYGSAHMLECWKAALGQNVLLLDDPDGICELIASTIAVYEGADLAQVKQDLVDNSTALATVDAVAGALAKYSAASDRPTALKTTSSGAPLGLAEV